jgi:hypothetical protein
MYICNPSSLSDTYKTTSIIIKNYLIENGIPLLSQEDGVFYFSQTNKLQQALNNSPIWMRLLF